MPNMEKFHTKPWVLGVLYIYILYIYNSMTVYIVISCQQNNGILVNLVVFHGSGTFPWIMTVSTKAFRTPLTLCTCAVSWFRQGIHEDSEDNEAPKELNACRKAELAFVVPAGAGWQVSLKFDTLPTIPYLVLPHMGTLHCILMWVYLYMCVYI